MTNIFYFEDEQENVCNEKGKKVFDPMEEVLMQVTDPNIVLQTVTSQKTYLSNRKHVSKTVAKASAVNPKPKKPERKSVYKDYSNKTREIFINRMIEHPEEIRIAARFARELDVNERTA